MKLEDLINISNHAGHWSGRIRARITGMCSVTNVRSCLMSLQKLTKRNSQWKEVYKASSRNVSVRSGHVGNTIPTAGRVKTINHYRIFNSIIEILPSYEFHHVDFYLFHCKSKSTWIYLLWHLSNGVILVSRLSHSACHYFDNTLILISILVLILIFILMPYSLLIFLFLLLAT